jgi:hypothetical protein
LDDAKELHIPETNTTNGTASWFLHINWSTCFF